MKLLISSKLSWLHFLKIPFPFYLSQQVESVSRWQPTATVSPLNDSLAAEIVTFTLFCWQIPVEILTAKTDFWTFFHSNSPNSSYHNIHVRSDRLRKQISLNHCTDKLLLLLSDKSNVWWQVWNTLVAAGVCCPEGKQFRFELWKNSTVTKTFTYCSLKNLLIFNRWRWFFS